MNTRKEARQVDNLKTFKPQVNIPGHQSQVVECPICNDREFIIQEQDGVDVAAPCKCRQAKIVKRLIKSSGLTQFQREQTFENYQPSRNPGVRMAYDLAMNYVHNFDTITREKHNGLALTGSVGTGKTHLLAAIANELITRGVPVVFVTTPDLLAELRAAQFDDTLENRIWAVGNTEVVILDDVAKEKTSEWVSTQYFRIINHRYANHLPTLFSSNHDFTGISDKVGDAVASRLYEMVKGRWAHIEAEDYRVREVG